MDDSAARSRGFNRVVIGRIEQRAGHFKANRGTDHKSPDEENDERLGKVDDQETNDQSDEAAAENILTELLLKGVEDQAPNIPPTRKIAIAVPVSAAVPMPRSVMMKEMFAPMTP